MNPSIKTISDFVGQITEADAQHDQEFFWRGHSDCSYKLSPNIYRKASKLVSKEHLILKEAIIRHPEEFHNRPSHFEKLALMQHYEFPTRLLDLTENPLVALYFSCKQKPAKDGEVILFKIKKDAVKYYDSDTVSVLSVLSCIPPDRFHDFNEDLRKRVLVLGEDNKALRTIKKRFEGNTNQAPITTLAKYLSAKKRATHTVDLLRKAFNDCALIDLLVYEIQSNKPHFRNLVQPEHFHDAVVCVKSKYDSRRIAAQQGAFLLFGIKDGDKLKPASLGDKIAINKFTIDKSAKPQLLKQLARMGISEERLFPEMMTSAKVIKEMLNV